MAHGFDPELGWVRKPNTEKDEKGKWSGLDVDACRAVAAAVLGDATKVSYKPLTAKERFTALQSGEIESSLFSFQKLYPCIADRRMHYDFLLDRFEDHKTPRQVRYFLYETPAYSSVARKKRSICIADS